VSLCVCVCESGARGDRAQRLQMMILLALFVISTTGDVRHNHEAISGSVDLLDKDPERIFDLRWVVNASAATIRFELRAETNGWFAVGFSDDNKMPKAGVAHLFADECLTRLHRHHRVHRLWHGGEQRQRHKSRHRSQSGHREKQHSVAGNGTASRHRVVRERSLRSRQVRANGVR
jgi:hypothetical protein